MTTLKIAISNILELEPNPIHCMALNDKLLKLALFRGGDVPAIEIWDVSHLPCLEKTLTHLEIVGEKASVESIVWINDRLFTCGLHGFILEHDLSTGRIKGKYAATSGPVWCIRPSPDHKLLAAATEDGFVNIFEVYDEEIQYVKVLDRQDGRILCLSWSPCGKYIATGSVDSLRLWDVEKGHAMQRIMTGRSRNNETIVWSIMMLEDFHIVTGDSRGLVSVYDGRMGILYSKIQSHRADVLCMVLSEDKSTIYAAGVDPMVVLISRVGKFAGKWVKSHQRIMHTNDVMCLATHGNKLYSGGIDADLVVSSFERNKIVTKYPPLPKPDRISLSAGSRRVLVQNGRTIDIWQLPTETQNVLVKLVELRSSKQDIIHSASMSPTGEFIAYSTESKMNFFRLSTLKTTNTKTAIANSSSGPTPTPSLQKLSISTEWDHPSATLNGFDTVDDEEDEADNNLLGLSLHFIDETQILAIPTNAPIFCFMQINKETGTLHKRRKNFVWMVGKDGITLISSSRDGSHLAVANSKHSIFVFEIQSDFSLSACHSIPHYVCQPTALSFHPSKPILLVAYVDHTVTVFNYELGKVLYSDKVFKKPSNLPSNNLQPILGASWSLKPEDEFIVLHDIETIYLMEPKQGDDENGDTELEGSSRKKLKRNRNLSNQVKELRFNVKTSPNKYKYIAHSQFLNNDNDILAIEVKPSSLLEKLPPAFAKKRFGM